MNRQHYSYTHYANRDVAAGFDALRFSGPIGEFLQATQAAWLIQMIAPLATGAPPEQPLQGVSVIDVGTGTGRAAIGLAQVGAAVTGVDASAEMLDVARQRAAELGLTVTFDVADAHALPFASATCDVAVSLRVLMHTPDWRRCVRELCRVSRRRVIVDFPSLTSAAALESVWRHGRRALGAKVEAYRVMSERAVRQAFEAEGYRVTAIHRQFVLPIAIHKALGSRRATLAIEGALRAVGLLWLLGSPVTVVAER